MSNMAYRVWLEEALASKIRAPESYSVVEVIDTAVETSENRDKRIILSLAEGLRTLGLTPDAIEGVLRTAGLVYPPEPPVTAEGPTIIPWDRDPGAKERFEQSRTALRAVPQHSHEPGTLGAMIHDREIPGVPCQDPGDDELHQAVTSLRAAAVAITTAAEDLARLLP